MDSKDLIIAAQAKRIVELELALSVLQQKYDDLSKRFDDLLRQLNKNSKNSSKPPSSDPPKSKAEREPHKNDTKKKRGGQPKHTGAHRKLVPENEVTSVRDLFPESCSHCHEKFQQTKDPNPRRYQTTDIPPIRPEVTEYRRHCVKCMHCNKKTRAEVVGIVPKYAFGPRLMAFVATLTGVYHLSRREVVDFLRDAFGIDISLGALSAIESRVEKSLQDANETIYQRAVHSNVKYVDGTGWREAGHSKSLWVMATREVTTFKIFENGSTDSIAPWLKPHSGILVSDRATVFSFWSKFMRQICWAHLKRKFQEFYEHTDKKVKGFGKELLEHTSVIFKQHHARRTNIINQDVFEKRIEPMRAVFEKTIEKLVSLDIPVVSGSCADILNHRDALWTFINHHNVEPTNNHAEQELRRFVLWRKSSFGAQSARGHAFASTLMSIARTTRKQSRSAFQFILASCYAWILEKPSPCMFETLLRCKSHAASAVATCSPTGQ